MPSRCEYRVPLDAKNGMYGHVWQLNVMHVYQHIDLYNWKTVVTIADDTTHHDAHAHLAEDGRIEEQAAAMREHELHVLLDGWEPLALEAHQEVIHQQLAVVNPLCSPPTRVVQLTNKSLSLSLRSITVRHICFTISDRESKEEVKCKLNDGEHRRLLVFNTERQINAMPVFPQYILEEHARTCTGSRIKVSVRQSVTGGLSIVKFKVMYAFRDLRHSRAGFSGIGFGQSAFNQMICAIHVKPRFGAFADLVISFDSTDEVTNQQDDVTT
eukprot:5284487-Pyramimonas_sp.AAC.1